MASANDETMRLAGGMGQTGESGHGLGMVTDAGLIELPSPPDTDGLRKGVNARPWGTNGMHPFGPRPVPQERRMEFKSLRSRLWLLSAGVLMNLVLAFVLLV